MSPPTGTVPARMVWSGHRPDGLKHLRDPRFVTKRDPADTRAAPGRRAEHSRHLRVGQATDLAVAQAVVDEREELAGHRGAGLVLAPALGNGVEVLAKFGGASPARHR